MRLGQIAAVLNRCFNTGATFLNEKFSLHSMQDFFLQFLIGLGIRKVNKFWPEVFIQGKPRVT